MNPEIAKLISAFAELADSLKERTGLPPRASTENVAAIPGPGYDDQNQKAIGESSGTLKPIEANRWSQISTIFAKTFFKIKKSEEADFGMEKSSPVVPTVINHITVPKEKSKEQSLFDKILKWLGPVLLLFGAAAAMLAAILKGPGALGNSLLLIGKRTAQLLLSRLGGFIANFADDAVKGLGGIWGKAASGVSRMIPSIGKLGTMFGGIAKKIGGILLKAARFLPGIGAFISFYFAYLRFKEGDIVGGIMNLASGILGLLEFVPGLGVIAFALGTAIDIATIARELTYTKEERLSESTKLVDMLKSVGEWVGDKLKKYARFLPVIGTLIHLWESYQKIKSGDYTGGMESLLNSLFPFIPNLGKTIMGGWGVMKSFFSDVTEKVQQSNIVTGTVNIFKELRNYITDKIKNLISKNFLFKVLSRIGSIGKNIIGGIGEMLGIFSAFAPESSAIYQGWSFLKSFFTDSEEEKSLTTQTGAKKGSSFIDVIYNYIRAKSKNLPWIIRKFLSWQGIIKDDTQDPAASTASPDSINQKMSSWKERASKAWDSTVSTSKSVADSINQKMSSWKEGASKAWDSTVSTSKSVADSINQKLAKKEDVPRNSIKQKIQAWNISSAKSWDNIISASKAVLYTIRKKIKEWEKESMSFSTKMAYSLGNSIFNLTKSTKMQPLIQDEEGTKEVSTISDKKTPNDFQIASSNTNSIKDGFNLIVNKHDEEIGELKKIRSDIINISNAQLKILNDIKGKVTNTNSSPSQIFPPLMPPGNGAPGKVSSGPGYPEELSLFFNPRTVQNII